MGLRLRGENGIINALHRTFPTRSTRSAAWSRHQEALRRSKPYETRRWTLRADPGIDDMLGRTWRVALPNGAVACGRRAEGGGLASVLEEAAHQQRVLHLPKDGRHPGNLPVEAEAPGEPHLHRAVRRLQHVAHAPPFLPTLPLRPVEHHVCHLHVHPTVPVQLCCTLRLCRRVVATGRGRRYGGKAGVDGCGWVWYARLSP